MKKIWMWILGIFLVLVVAAGFFGLGFLHQTRMRAVAVNNSAPKGTPNPQAPRSPMRGGFPEWRGGRGMPPRVGPMMGTRGFGRGPFPGGMFFGMFGRLIPLALVLLVLYGAYRFGKSRSVPMAVVAAPVQAVAPPIPVFHPCPACGNAVQDDWKHCPNCGEKQA